MSDLSSKHLEMDSTRRPDAAVVLRSGLAHALMLPGAEALSALAQGCLVTLYRHSAGRVNFTTCGSAISELDGRVALSMRGVQATEIDLVFAALRQSGLLNIVDSQILFPGLDAALSKEARKLAARLAGWRSRIGIREDAAPAAGGQARSAHQVASASAASTASSSEAPDRKSPVIRGHRLGATTDAAPAADVTLYRFACKDGLAELTESYYQHLRAVYPRVDVDQQLRTAALWCESNPGKRKTVRGTRAFVCKWLNKARETADLSAMMIKTQSARNGFGNGGGYNEHAGASASTDDDLDDLAGIQVPPASSEARSVTQPASRANPVYAARQRQRRLSEMSRG